MAGLASNAAVGPLAPLAHASFRSLWTVWLLSNMCLWMWSVAAAWMMVELGAAPLWVALVQSATTLPLLVLGLPMGAVADMVDRRRMLLFTQVWMGAIALVQALWSIVGTTPATVLLATTFLYGCGVAMRNPAYLSTVPSLVPREQMPAALALNSAAQNASRVLGPMVAGGMMLLAGGPHATFLVAAGVAGLSLWLVRAWQPNSQLARPRPASLWASLRGGLDFVRSSRPFRSILLRVALLSFTLGALPALLPLVARDIRDGDATTFSVLFAAMGFGAVLSMTALHRLRVRYAPTQLELAGTIAHALAVLALVWSRSLPLAVLAMVVAGWAWMMSANSMTLAAQLIFPDEFRARGVSIYQMALMGSLAVGAAFWGQVATVTDVHISLGVSGLCAPVGVALAIHVMRALDSSG